LRSAQAGDSAAAGLHKRGCAQCASKRSWCTEPLGSVYRVGRESGGRSTIAQARVRKRDALAPRDHRRVAAAQ
jgi:hypothetical protein